MTKNKLVIVVGGGILLLLVILQLTFLHDGKLHIVFCDVGQGDGVFIRTPSGKEIILDGGPNNAVLSCLDAHRPFWDRTLDIMILSHPHYDHFRGLIDVLDRYKIGMVFQEPLINTSEAYTVFSQAVEDEETDVGILTRGVKLSFSDGVIIQVLGPDDPFVKRENPQGVTESDNPPSLILHLTYHTFDLLLTGDSDGEDLEKFIPKGVNPEVLMLPHHGSQNGYTAAAAKKIIPKIAVISNGKNNSYGHPHQSVLKELKQHKSQILRTDHYGHIHLVIDETGAIAIQSNLSD